MNRSAFYDALRPWLGSLTQKQVDGMEAILNASTGLPIQYTAYLLATAYHETGGTLAPNRENMSYSSAARIRAVWPSRFPTEASAAPYVRNPVKLANKVYNGRLGNREGTNDGWDYRGGGQVHTTGRDNYEKVKRATGVDVINYPEKITQPNVSAIALVRGCVEGWYTGMKLSDYLPGDYVGARRVVNGTDRASDIAAYARHFEGALAKGGYSTVSKPQTPAPAPAPTPTPTTPLPPTPAWLLALLNLFKRG